MFSVARMVAAVKSNNVFSAKGVSAATHYMITAKMRAILNDELSYSQDDIKEMTPNFAAELIKIGRKKEVITSEEDMARWREYFKENSCLPDYDYSSERDPSTEFEDNTAPGPDPELEQ
jgi:hypothetical protein